MNLNYFLNRPEYIYQPSSIYKRIFSTKKKNEYFQLPWHCKIKVPFKGPIQDSLRAYGLYDIALTESVWRLLKEDDIFLDIGANIGYITT